MNSTSITTGGYIKKGEVMSEIAPSKMVRKILQTYHDLPQTEHLGFDKTLELIKRTFYWKGMARDIKEYCSKCLSCAGQKMTRDNNSVRACIYGYHWTTANYQAR